MTPTGAPETRSSSEPNPVERAERSTLSVMGLLLLALLYLLPKNAISRGAGRFASIRLPAVIQRFEIRLFARLAGVDLGEAKEPVAYYETLQQFFVRALREGARPIEGDDKSLNAPCDGAWGESGAIDNGTMIQVKGRSYGAAELLGDRDLAECYEGGHFATFYLSPRDYHRFHTPAAGRIHRIDYCPGSLWPVNAIGLQGIDRLFARNERICAFLEVDGAANETPIALVAVGATMVGSVCLAFDELTTNVAGARSERREFGARAPTFQRGEEWGHFEFGSTIVMLLPPGLYDIEGQAVGQALRLGEIIGRRSQ